MNLNQILFHCRLVSAGAIGLLSVTILFVSQTADAQLDLAPVEIDHAGIIRDWNDESFERGKRFFESSCVGCHGELGQSPTHPQARAFGKEPFRYGNDPYSMYRTLTYGAGAMLPQTWLAPAERYDVVHYIREAMIKPSRDVKLFPADRRYLSGLPKGVGKGLRTKTNPRDFGPVLTSQIERRVNLAKTFDLGRGLYMSVDVQRMAVSDVWKGSLDLSQTQHVRLRGERQPVPVGQKFEPLTHWYWCVGEGYEPPPSNRHETWIDGSESSSPLDPRLANYRGHYVYGRNAVLSYSILGREVLEMPGAAENDGLPILHHTLHIAPGQQELNLSIARFEADDYGIADVFPLFVGGSDEDLESVSKTYAMVGQETEEGNYAGFAAAGVVGDTDGMRWVIDSDERIVLSIPASTEPIRVRVYRAAGDGPGHVEGFVRFMTQAYDTGQLAVPDLQVAKKGGPRLWREEFSTNVTLDDVRIHYDPADYEKEEERRPAAHQHFPYTIDTVELPEPNPWNAWMRMSDLAFFDDGTLAVSTLGGDVWLVEDVSGTSGKAKWTRFASGMFEPLGLRIIDGIIHVTDRSGIVRLHDLNGDRQADYYENLYNDHEISNGFHGYNFDLLQGDDDSLYYIKPGRFTDYRRPGSVVKVSPDGSDYEIMATGFRVPNGMGMGPDGTIFATDNQGSWVPANKINRIEPGNFYGVFQRSEKEREDYNLPVYWLPQEFDNSPGNLVHVGDERFGPLSDKMIVTSFGKGWAYYIMPEVVDGVWQGGAAAFPFQFHAGLMRAAVNPADGQVYVTGLTGWDTESTNREGCLQRIRFTGAKGTVLVNTGTTQDGFSLTFSQPMDTGAANRLTNYEIERWNYKRTPRYGSAHYSIENPDEEGHDEVIVTGVTLGDDGKTIRIATRDMRSADTVRIRYSLRNANGEAVRDTIYFTVHRVPN